MYPGEFLEYSGMRETFSNLEKHGLVGLGWFEITPRMQILPK